MSSGLIGPLAGDGSDPADSAAVESIDLAGGREAHTHTYPHGARTHANTHILAPTHTVASDCQV